MRSLRMLAFIVLFVLFAATPHIGSWVSTATASPARHYAADELEPLED